MHIMAVIDTNVLISAVRQSGSLGRCGKM